MGFPGFFMITSLIGNMLLPVPQSSRVPMTTTSRQQPSSNIYQIRVTYSQKGCRGNATAISASKLRSPIVCNSSPCSDATTWGSSVTTCNQTTSSPDLSFISSLCPGCAFCGQLWYANNASQCDPSIPPDQILINVLDQCVQTSPPFPSSIYGMCHRTGVTDNITVFLNNTCTGASFAQHTQFFPSISCNPSQGYCWDPMFVGPPQRYYGFCSLATAVPPIPSSTTSSSTTTRPASAPRLFAKGALIGFGLALAIGIMPTR